MVPLGLFVNSCPVLGGAGTRDSKVGVNFVPKGFAVNIGRLDLDNGDNREGRFLHDRLLFAAERGPERALHVLLGK